MQFLLNKSLVLNENLIQKLLNLTQLNHTGSGLNYTNSKSEFSYIIIRLIVIYLFFIGFILYVYNTKN